MNSKKILIYILGIIIIALIIWFVFTYVANAPHNEITDFDQCAAAGNPIMESYPARCSTKDGKTFTQDIGNEFEKKDLIRIDNPRPNAVVGNTIEISGEARGQWFFEASFPIKLIDEKGNILATTVATAKSDWMTEDFVLFEAKIEFTNTEIEKADLMLLKDNPSGLPENDDFLRVPIKFE
ncbi:MAG: Gmad2 immunoglobulin-like domain-containing protein [Candidatus Pacebacteria bacterium]|nr:Gmad2 immunoglobulin-like domain-containing protein [Candidatus Paceibacterota bacterium]MDD5621013.1 Gmad2 immunoglobulin-like domain-containing protein [Candidatus Paceibacterota bacterium]